MEKFSTEKNGYNREEVKQFINDVIVQTEDIIKRCKKQSEELEKLRSELDYYKKFDASIRKSIINAEETCNNMRKVAQDESENIIANAKTNASRIVNDALLKAEQVETKAAKVESNMRVFKRKLKMIMEEQMAVIEEIEVLELESE